LSADQLLTALFNAGVAVSIIATVLSLGMSFTVAQLLAPLRRVVLVSLMVVLNVLVIPAAAWGIAKAFGLSDDAVTGVTLAAIGAAGASGLKAAQLSKRADLALAVSIVVVLQLLNLIAVPLWAGQVVTGASISGATILKDLLGLVLIPLVVGMFVRARYPGNATSWEPDLVKVANLALVIALVAGIAVNWSAIVSLLGSRVLLASATIALVGLVLGVLVGGKDPAVRTTTGLISSLRFGSLGLIIVGTQLGGKPSILGPAIVFALVNMVIAMAVAVEIGRKAGDVSRAEAPHATNEGGPPR
jgi:BASS family bile acid:Na+ symporter